MNTRNIRQTVSFAASPRAVYEALMDSRQHSAITESKAVIGRRPGSAFSVWDGDVRGLTVCLQPNEKIVQAWRSSDWPAGHYSIASFTMVPAPGGTKLVFEQFGVPASAYKGIAVGWKDYYWRGMKRRFSPRVASSRQPRPAITRKAKRP